MKIFTVEEANELIPQVRSILFKIQQTYKELAEYRESAKKAAKASQFGGGGFEGGSKYVCLTFQIGKLTSTIDALDIQLKDYSLGLIDFPCMLNDKIVLLCWKLGEGDVIEWYHDIDSGFAGRKPLSDF